MQHSESESCLLNWVTLYLLYMKYSSVLDPRYLTIYLHLSVHRNLGIEGKQLSKAHRRTKADIPVKVFLCNVDPHSYPGGRVTGIYGAGSRFSLNLSCCIRDMLVHRKCAQNLFYVIVHALHSVRQLPSKMFEGEKCADFDDCDASGSKEHRV